MPPNFANSRPEFCLLTLSAVAAPSTALFSLSALSLSPQREARLTALFSPFSRSLPPRQRLRSRFFQALERLLSHLRRRRRKINKTSNEMGSSKKKPGAPSGGVHSNLPPEVAAAKAELIDVENKRTTLVEELRLVEKQVRCDER